MSSGMNDRINNDNYWYNKHNDVVEENKKLIRKIKRLENKLNKAKKK